MLRDDTCTLCKLGAAATSSANVCISGVGGRRVMVVTLRPLADKRRTELVNYFVEAGIPESDLFITSAARCRVWEVEPTKTELKLCARTYLDDEIRTVAPEIIVPLGNEALLAVTGKSGILKYRGMTLAHSTGTPAIATISPAMVARNPGLRAGLVADLAYVSRVLSGRTDASEGVAPRTLGVTTPTGVNRLCERLRAAEGVALDIETNGFSEHARDGVILSVAFTVWDAGDTAPREKWALPLGHPESPFVSDWRKVLEHVWRTGLAFVKKVVAHNGKFDLRWLHHFGCPVELTFDTMLAAHLLDENRPKSLDSLARTLLGSKPWKIDNKTLISVPLKRVLVYNAGDTWETAGLYFVLRDQLRAQPRLAKLMTRMMVPASNEFVSIEREGIWTDREKMQSHGAIARRTLADMDAELIELVPPRDEWPAGVKEVNFNASNFARWWLFDYMGLPVLARGKDKEDGSEGMPSMAEAVMLKLAADHPDNRALQLMIERTKWQKYSSAFFAAYEEQITDDDRIHTTFKLTGTVTGRLSSGKGDDDKVTGRVQNRGVNLQQVPRDDFVRGIFGAPPGSVFVECDYSQVELRVAAFLANEPTMKHLYNTGQDIHMTMAMRMTGKPQSEVTKEERKKAKAVNFGFLYGMGATKFVDTAWSNYGVVVSPAEAQAFRRAFFEQFGALNAWHNRQRRLAAQFKRVESPLGRVRHLPDIDSPNEGVKREAERQAINSPVQSFASDMCLWSLVLLSKLFRKRGFKAHSVGTVHDAINFEVPLDEVDVVVPLIRRVMQELPLESVFGVVLDVPIIADCKIGTRWGSALEVPNDISSNGRRLHTWVREHADEIGIG